MGNFTVTVTASDHAKGRVEDVFNIEVSSPITGIPKDYELQGTENADTLSGDRGNDSLYGGEGSDTLYGQEGDDLLDGGNGSDTLYGGDGVDTFVLAPGMGQDTIDDFTNHTDKIRLEGGLIFTELEIASHQGSSTSIKVAASGEVLAILSGIDYEVIRADDFV
ncbi:MAG: hypothetical protein EBE86_009630 [Hormoscilla sp. GUM202]|nr:hypothetical protein [Hormoscilla sp. GUM202]